MRYYKHCEGMLLNFFCLVALRVPPFFIQRNDRPCVFFLYLFRQYLGTSFNSFLFSVTDYYFLINGNAGTNDTDYREGDQDL